ncbi:MAG: hypothetical protein SF052_13035, partial [Bacteroidia bacterium]|nr:hypothetical protein [Bacteroidia bacterium]
VLKVDNTFHTYFKAEKVAVSDLKHPTNFPSLLSDYFINKIWLLEEEKPHEKEEPTAHQLTFQNLLFAQDTTYLTTPYYALTRLKFSLNFFQIKEARDLDDEFEIGGWNYFVWEDYVVLTIRNLDRIEDSMYYFSLFSEKEVVLKGSQGAVISLRLME